jgi:hypothetical protein
VLLLLGDEVLDIPSRRQGSQLTLVLEGVLPGGVGGHEGQMGSGRSSSATRLAHGVVSFVYVQGRPGAYGLIRLRPGLPDQTMHPPNPPTFAGS